MPSPRAGPRKNPPDLSPGDRRPAASPALSCLPRGRKPVHHARPSPPRTRVTVPASHPRITIGLATDSRNTTGGTPVLPVHLTERGLSVRAGSPRLHTPFSDSAPTGWLIPLKSGTPPNSPGNDSAAGIGTRWDTGRDRRDALFSPFTFAPRQEPRTKHQEPRTKHQEIGTRNPELPLIPPTADSPVPCLTNHRSISHTTSCSKPALAIRSMPPRF